MPLTQVREAEAYAASARAELAVMKCASGFTRWLTTWARSDILAKPVEACRPLAANLAASQPFFNDSRTVTCKVETCRHVTSQRGSVDVRPDQPDVPVGTQQV